MAALSSVKLDPLDYGMFEKLVSNLSNTFASLAQVRKELAEAQKTIADLQGTVDMQRHNIEVLEGRNKALFEDNARLQNALAASEAEAVVPIPAPQQ